MSVGAECTTPWPSAPAEQTGEVVQVSRDSSRLLRKPTAHVTQHLQCQRANGQGVIAQGRDPGRANQL